METPAKPEKGYLNGLAAKARERGSYRPYFRLKTQNATVEFVEDSPREVKFRDRYGPPDKWDKDIPPLTDGLAIGVVNLGTGMQEDIFMRAEENATLTTGILALWEKKHRRLTGVRATIMVRVADTKKHKDARLYSVVEAVEVAPPRWAKATQEVP